MAGRGEVHWSRHLLTTANEQISKTVAKACLHTTLPCNKVLCLSHGSQYSKVTTTVQSPLSAVLHVTVTVTMTMVAMVTIETSLWTIHYLFNIMQCFAQHGLHLANTVCLMKPEVGKGSGMCCMIALIAHIPHHGFPLLSWSQLL